MLSSVPQGSVLGPFLFLVLINDIETEIEHSMVSSFADDTRVTKNNTTIQDTKLLQRDLNKIYNWATENNMEFNETKFEVLRYGRDNNIKENTNYQTTKGTILGKDNLKDLGVIVSNEATFKQYISSICESARRLSS